MAKLSWGKPTVEITKSVNGAIPSSPAAVWKALSEIKEGTATLTTTKGEKTDALEEGGGVVDVRYKKNTYAFELQLFVKKGDQKPVEDVDGIITDNYALRLTPEDDANEGFLMENASVSVEESWTAADGKMWKYTFEGIKPAEGAILKPYTKTAE